MSAELALITDPDQIAALPVEERGVVITRALEESKSWLAVATKGTDPTPIVEFKAWAATVAEMTRQKHLSEEIQLDALEMVRRAERGIGVAIRNGQEAGEIAKRGDIGALPGPRAGGQPGHARGQHLVRPTDFATVEQLSSNGTGFYSMTDGVTDEQFDDAIRDARQEEKSLSRASVVRKIRSPSRLTPDQRLNRIREMASDRYTSEQIAAAIGLADVSYVRELARGQGIDVPADAVTHRTKGKQVDPQRIVRETVNALQGLEYGVDLLLSSDYDRFSSEDIRDWLDALETPARALRTLIKELKARVR